MIVNHDVLKAIEQMSPQRAKLIELWHFDVPWPYSQTHRTGNVDYSAMPFEDISWLVRRSYALANDEAFMVLWMTFPMLMDPGFDHLRDTAPWTGYTGGVWAKTSGFGTGNVVRGDAEFALIYRKGKPKRTGRAYSNLWLADRKGHSEKPQVSLRGMLSSMTTEGGYVFDAFCGESASMPIACRSMRRNCISFEIDKTRYETACHRLAQQELPLATQQSEQTNLTLEQDSP